MLNKSVLMGRLTADPTVRYTTNTNTLVCSFTIAVDRRFTKQGEEKETDFIPVVAWGKIGEFASKYFTKGKMAIVTGRIQVRTWTDNNDAKRYTTEIVADDVMFGETKRDQSNENKSNNDATNVANDDFFASVVADNELGF